jgi:hypothetical protein
MKRLRLRLRRPALAALVVLVLAGALAGVTFAAFSSQTDNPGNSVAAAPDYRAPTVSPMTIQKSTGGRPGAIRQNASYRVYASITDTGNPASGIASATSDTSVFDAAQTANALTAGSYTVDGVSYNYRSALLTADAVIAAGSKGWSITSADNASNSATTNGTVSVDNTGTASSTVQATNTSGGTVGRAEAGDTLTYTFGEPVDTISILAAWTTSSASQTVTLRLNQNAGGDNITIFNSANTTQLPMGTINLGRTDYTTVNRTFTGSTMTTSGNNVTIVLGTASGGVTTAAGNGTMAWTPTTTVTDIAGNALLATVANENGAGDKEF